MREFSATGGGGAARFGREGGDPELAEDEARGLGTRSIMDGAVIGAVTSAVTNLMIFIMSRTLG